MRAYDERFAWHLPPPVRGDPGLRLMAAAQPASPQLRRASLQRVLLLYPADDGPEYHYFGGAAAERHADAFLRRLLDATRSGAWTWRLDAQAVLEGGEPAQAHFRMGGARVWQGLRAGLAGHYAGLAADPMSMREHRLAAHRIHEMLVGRAVPPPVTAADDARRNRSHSLSTLRPSRPMPEGAMRERSGPDVGPPSPGRFARQTAKGKPPKPGPATAQGHPHAFLPTGLLRIERTNSLASLHSFPFDASAGI